MALSLIRAIYDWLHNTLNLSSGCLTTALGNADSQASLFKGSCPRWLTAPSQLQVMLRSMVSRPVYLGVKPPSRGQDKIFITFKQLRVFWCGAPSLSRGQVCLQLLLVLASAVILGSESLGNHDHILLSQIRDSSNVESLFPVFISPRNRVAQLYWVPFSSPPTIRRVTVEVFDSASTREGAFFYSLYISSGRTQQKTPLLTVPLLLHSCSFAAESICHVLFTVRYHATGDFF
jgi:hypothetical protein